MKILSHFSNVNFYNKKPNKKYPNLSHLKADTFSFCGNIEQRKQEDKNPVEYEYFVENLKSLGIKTTDKELIDWHYQTINGYLKELSEDRKKSIEEEVKNVDKFKGEFFLEKYVIFLAELFDLDNLIKDLLQVQATRRFSINHKTDDILDNRPLAKKMLLEAGFNLPKDIDKYIQQINTKDNIEFLEKTHSQYMAVQVFSALNKKEDFGIYLPVLINIALNSGNGYTLDGVDPNEITDFFKKTGVENLDDFDNKFDYLIPKYNDIDSIEDLIKLIADFKKEYPKRIEFLSTLSKKFPENFDSGDIRQLERLYSKHHNVLEYIYSKQNSKDYPEKLPYYVDYLTNSDKLTDKILKQLPTAETLDNSISEYNFMELMAEFHIKIDEIIFMSQNSLISNNDLSNCILNKEKIVSTIINTSNISKKEAEKIYLNFANEYNALLKEAKNQDDNSDLFDGLLEKDSIIEDFTKILYDYKVLDNVDKDNTGTKLLKDLLQSLGFSDYFNSKKQMTSDKFTEIIGLLRLFDSKEKIIEEYNASIKKEENNKSDKKVSKKFSSKAKSKENIPNNLRKILQNEKLNFKKLKPIIENYIKSDDSGFYSDKSVLDIYKIYKKESKLITDTKFRSKKEELSEEESNEIKEDVKNVLDFFKKGLSFDIELNRKLEKLIPDKKLIRKFLGKNDISLNSNNPYRDEEYIANALKILELFEGDFDNYRNIIEYFAQTDFIKLSKNELNEFFKTYKEPSFQKEILTAVANSKVKNLSEFNNFIKKYSAEEGRIENLIEFLNNQTSGMDLESLVRDFLTPLKRFMENYDLDFEVDNSTIKNLNYKNIRPFCDYTISEILELINNISGAKKDCNFISALPKLIIGIQENELYNSRNIASEYINYKNGGRTNDKVPYKYLKNIFEKEDTPAYSDFIFSKEKELIQRQIPTDFVRLINNPSWLKIDDEHIFNMTLHAKMRFIDRFILPELKDPQDLYLPSTKAMMNKKIKEIYNQCTHTPTSSIRADKGHGNRFSVNFYTDSKPIRANFNGKGTMITLFEVLERY